MTDDAGGVREGPPAYRFVILRWLRQFRLIRQLPRIVPISRPASAAAIFLPPSQRTRWTSMKPPWPWMTRLEPVWRHDLADRLAFHLGEGAGDALGAVEQEQFFARRWVVQAPGAGLQPRIRL